MVYTFMSKYAGGVGDVVDLLSGNKVFPLDHVNISL